ncbi:coiled-coil domain-containing protein 40-like [Mercenaria mercenaria]|uniref:coiled-coil domain-containing protein 40-like n=1 Tax=Mercenaria mercenaria TaxID=6596 RepID=UPI00234F5A2F|nr:coiled-coil domain-containing protein 40-like [Mercenaria mercenaria]
MADSDPTERPASSASKKDEVAENTGTGEPSEAQAERPPSGRPQSAAKSAAGSRPTSAKPGSRPASGKPGSRPASGKPGSRPVSAKSGGSNRPPSAPRSGRGSAADNKAPSPEAVEQPVEQQGEQPGVDREETGQSLDRPASAGSRKGSRPASASRPQSASREQTQDTAGAPAPGGDDGDGDNVVEDDFQGMDQNYGQLMAAGGGGPPDGDGSDGSGDDDEEEDEGQEEDSDEGSDAESNVMVVLEPDHPLMKRFQAALKNQLTKQNEKVTLELRELDESLKNRKKEREDLGVDLYGIQQELARYQMMLEKRHDEFSEVKQVRTQEEQQLEDVRNMYKDLQYNANVEKKKTSELQGEVENLALRLFYMQNAKEDVRSDIAIMRRAAEKADTEVAKAEIEKQKQDLFVDRLVERVDKLKEEIAMYEAQLTAQLEETKAAKEQLMEAYMEIEAISLEKKQLYQQWNSSLIGMRRRDEAHAAMLEALSQQQQKVLSLETEIEGYKKSIQKEQEQNEKLTLILNKTERDIETVKKQLTQCQSKHDALKSEYATYTRILHETEQSLNRAMTDKTLRQNELNALWKQIEREYLEKVKLEDDIMEKMRSQLTMDKAAQYTKKLTTKKRELTKQLETQMAEVENDISQNTLQISNVKARIERLQKISADLDKEIARQNEIINKSESEIVRRNAIIERKQNLIDQFNKKLEVMISKAGGVELGPLEININSLQKSIDARVQEIVDLQQLWLRQQTELVRLSKDKDEQSVDVTKLKKQLTILTQKKARTEGEIDGQRLETYEIERSISNMQNDMIKLNKLLHKEKGTQVMLQQDNILKENDFITRLKDHEHESIELQTNLEALKEEKERLLNSLVEAERQIMLWEKKTQLARETRAAVDSEVGQGEVRAMKAEIHRMQVRYSQLMKQQEKMIQEMEKAVSRRDTIVTRGDASQKINKKVLTKGTFERQMNETRKKIKQTIQEANSCDGEIQQLRDHQTQLSSQLEQGQLNVQSLQSNSDTIDGDIDRLIEVKQKNMTELLARQQKMKYYQQAKEGKYNRLCKSEASLESEYQKQVDRMQSLSAIVDRLNQEYPHAQPTLRRVTVNLSSKSVDDESL